MCGALRELVLLNRGSNLALNKVIQQEYILLADEIHIRTEVLLLQDFYFLVQSVSERDLLGLLCPCSNSPCGRGRPPGHSDVPGHAWAWANPEPFVRGDQRAPSHSDFKRD